MDELRFAPATRGLVMRLTGLLADEALAASTLRLVIERAPDERLALAFLLQLAETGVAQLAETLRVPGAAADLIFCLGASEYVGSGLTALGQGWSSFFLATRTHSAAMLLDSIHFDPPAANDRNEASRLLG